MVHPPWICPWTPDVASGFSHRNIMYNSVFPSWPTPLPHSLSPPYQISPQGISGSSLPEWEGWDLAKVVHEEFRPFPTGIWIARKVRENIIVKKFPKSTKSVSIKNMITELCNLYCYPCISIMAYEYRTHKSNCKSSMWGGNAETLHYHGARAAAQPHLLTRPNFLKWLAPTSLENATVISDRFFTPIDKNVLRTHSGLSIDILHKIVQQSQNQVKHYFHLNENCTSL